MGRANCAEGVVRVCGEGRLMGEKKTEREGGGVPGLAAFCQTTLESYVVSQDKFLWMKWRLMSTEDKKLCVIGEEHNAGFECVSV